jgi:hypothetical protein
LNNLFNLISKKKEFDPAISGSVFRCIIGEKGFMFAKARCQKPVGGNETFVQKIPDDIHGPRGGQLPVGWIPAAAADG